MTDFALIETETGQRIAVMPQPLSFHRTHEVCHAGGHAVIRVAVRSDLALLYVEGKRVGNPVARVCVDQCEVRHAAYDPNLIRPEKPERGRDKARIDAVPAAAMAVAAWKSRVGVDLYRSASEDNDLMVV